MELKKLYILIALLIGAISIKANAVTATLDTISVKTKEVATFVDTSSNFKHVYGDIKAGLVGLAAGLKVGVEHVYTVLIKQQIVYSITWLIIIIALIIFTVIFKKIYIYAKDNWVDMSHFMFTLFGGAGLVIGYITVLCNLTTIITGFVNPEYGAIKDIINFIK